ncbi:MAG: NAD(P)H-binding protein [Bacteroidales bacterium]
MKRKTAVVFGATGLVGSELVRELESDERYSAVKVLVRRDVEFDGEKTEVLKVNVSDVNSYATDIKGDELFICLGTTIKKAGSVSAMEAADRDLPAEIAIAAINNGVEAVAVVSSIGADPGSRNYYLRIKGEMEERIAGAGFKRTVIVRPSILFGKRKEYRFGEEMGKAIMKVFRFLLMGRLRKYRGIEARDVARAMIRLINDRSAHARVYYESDSLLLLYP